MNPRKMFVVHMGYNDLKSYLGVFSSREEAVRQLVAAGCTVRFVQNKWFPEGKELIETTEAFADWLAARNMSAYSTGASFAEGRPIHIDAVDLDTISNGYDDD